MQNLEFRNSNSQTGMKTIAALVISLCTLSTYAQTGTNKAQIEKGKGVYETYCLACHQADGSGVPDLNPPLIKTKWTMGDKKTLINVLLKGLDQEIDVNGETFANVMPAMSHLSDDEIADVLTYVRNNFENKATAVTAKEVKAQRAAK
jgi:mono/diheme cytochrome c family protein